MINFTIYNGETEEIMTDIQFQNAIHFNIWFKKAKIETKSGFIYSLEIFDEKGIDLIFDEHFSTWEELKEWIELMTEGGPKDGTY